MTSRITPSGRSILSRGRLSPVRTFEIHLIRSLYIHYMPARMPPDPDAKPQIEKFREMVRELGCDEDEDGFKAKLAQVIRHRTKVEPSKKPTG